MGCAAIAAGLMVVIGIATFLALARLYGGAPRTRWVAMTAAAIGLGSCAALLGIAAAPGDRNPMLHGRFTLIAAVPFSAATFLFGGATSWTIASGARVPLGHRVALVITLGWIAHPTPSAIALDMTLVVTFQKLVLVAIIAVFYLESYEAENWSRSRPR